MKNYPIVCAVLLAAIATALSGGCASSVDHSAESAPGQHFVMSPTQKVAAVAISVAPEAQDDIKDNLKFDQEALRQHVERAIVGYADLDASGKGTLPTIEVVITAVRVRSNFTAVVAGFMAGADSIHGEILVKDPSGKELDHFKVSVSYALGGFAGGQDSTRMDWMYEEFAKQTVQELVGPNKTARNAAASKLGGA